MATKSGGRLVAEALARHGVTHLFTLSGGHIGPIYESAGEAGIRLIDTRHEQAAVFMAEAWARLHRRPAVALATAGPGFTNTITAVANARVAEVPLVVMAGSVATTMAGRLDLQDMVQKPVIEPLVKWAGAAGHAGRIPDLVDRAFGESVSGTPGPVYLELPVDVLGEEVEAEDELPTPTDLAVRTPGNPAQIEKAVGLIAEAERPVVICGNGAWFSGAEAAVARFAEEAGVPIFTTGMAAGILGEDHPYGFGPAVAIRPGASAEAMARADVMLLLGTRMDLYLLFGGVFDSRVKIIHVHPDGAEIGRNRPARVGIVGDVGLVLDQILEIGGGRLDAGRTRPWVEDCRRLHEQGREMFGQMFPLDQIPIHPVRLCQEVDRFLGPEGIVAVDGGDTQVWVGMTRTHHRSCAYLESGLFGCLGVGLPFALSAKLAHPDARVCLVTGDGSIGFNFMEFQTALRLGIPVVVVVSNDLGWGMIRHSQQIKYGDQAGWAAELGDVPYYKLVQALGGYGERVERPEEIAPALERAFESGTVACVDVLTDPAVISPGSYALANISGE